MFDYFDESYFQQGSLKGTVYNDYVNASRKSEIYKEIAFSIHKIFQPVKVLEIGCATGIMVKYLNALGCEAHGIDVSPWAVDNREHVNVTLNSADSLPFPDNYFDLVFSCHSLEHIPDELFEKSIMEMTRVCSKYHFHMLPMIGTKPYCGNVDEVIAGLKKDQSHHQLHKLDWWVERFENASNIPLNVFIPFVNDNNSCELTYGQLVFKKNINIDESDIAKHAVEYSQEAFEYRPTILNRHGYIPIKKFSLNNFQTLEYEEKIWKDVACEFNKNNFLDIRNKKFMLIAFLLGQECSLRIALGDDYLLEPYLNAAEYYFTLKSGLNWFNFSVSDFKVLRGNPDFSSINRVALGGQAENSRIEFLLIDNEDDFILK